MDEGENVHIEGFGGHGGFGQHPALILMNMPLGFTDPELRSVATSTDPWRLYRSGSERLDGERE